jgi:hypothetical protein
LFFVSTLFLSISSGLQFSDFELPWFLFTTMSNTTAIVHKIETSCAIININTKIQCTPVSQLYGYYLPEWVSCSYGAILSDIPIDLIYGGHCCKVSNIVWHYGRLVGS